MPAKTRQERLSAKYLQTACRHRGRENRLERDAIAELLEATRSLDPLVRKEAANALCPCHIQGEIPGVWERLIEMVADPDAKVRGVILHTLADGSPREREAEVVAAIERMYHDPVPKLRRRVRKLLASYRACGNINLL
jgi:HEAT repeat protein